MKKLITLLILLGLTIFSAYGQTSNKDSLKYFDISNLYPKDTLFLIYEGDFDELGVPCGYVNQKGDTIIPIGKYQYCFFDTVTTFAIVMDSSCVFAIDQNENRLYEVYWYDNGPDYFKDGLFRIKRNGKIGFANKKGEIVINPQYKCANPFENGKAQVTYDCELIKEDEYTLMKSDNWFYIDKSGNKIE